jgi:hypothetical protein
MPTIGVRVFGFLFVLVGFVLLIAPQFAIGAASGWKVKDTEATTLGRLDARLGGLIILAFGLWLMTQ